MDWPGEQLLIKLWETLAEKGIGSLLTPWQIIREGKARNEIRHHELLMLAQAEVDANEIRAGRKQLNLQTPLSSLPAPTVLRIPDTQGIERIEPHLDFDSLAAVSMRSDIAQAAQKEINISKAIIHAENELFEDNQPASEKKVDDDWLYSWRDYAGRISSEDLQQLWGKILAGEVKSPGKYSLRTLEFLKGLSKSEAEQISRLAQFVIHGMIARDVLEPLEKAGLSFAVLLQMQDLGVLSGVESIGLKRTFTSVVTDKFIVPIVAGNKALIIEHAAPAKKLELSVYLITTIGAQLLELGQFEPNLEYLRQLGKKIATQDFTVRLADWKPDNNGGGSYFNAVQVTA